MTPGSIGRRRSVSLQTRFMLTFGSVVVGVMALVIFVAAQRQHRTALDQIEKRGAVIAQSVASAALPSLYEYDNSSMQRLADEVRADTGALYVIIHNKESIVGGYSGRADLQGGHLDDAVSRAALGSTDVVAQRHQGGINAGGAGIDAAADVLEIALPVIAGAERWGTVRVGLSLGEMRTELARTLRDLALLGVTSVILVLVSARLLTGRVTGPLRQLAEATALVAEGQLDHSIDEDLLAELGDVARGFNKMTQDLRRSRDALRYQKQHLENMVQERTAALRQKARELEKANRELKEVDRLKSDFLSNVSHELRTPLTSIRSFTEILIDGHNVSEEEENEFLSIIASQTDRLTRLIGDLLDLSKIEAGEFHCNVDSMPLVELVLLPCMETLKHVAAEARVELVADLPSELPLVLGDADRLSQVTMNLVDNALKFTEAGGRIALRVFSSDRRVPTETLHGGELRGVESDTPEGSAYLVVEVHDTGRGIPERDQQRIFEKFGQVGNVLTNKPQGTGLGLTISANIMAQLGGAIWVHSVEGEGSTFWYSVPIHASAGATPVPVVAGPKRRGEVKENALDHLIRALDENARGPRVLVVDDSEDIIERITATLEPLGYRAMGCVGGQYAVDRVRDLEPDVVVLDAMMPDVSGYDVLRRLKQDRRTADVAIVVLGPASESSKAFELGAADHVAKDASLESEAPVPARV